MNTKVQPTILGEHIPTGYPICLHTQCPLAATCLHQLLFRQHETLGTYLQLLNPAKCTGPQDSVHPSCPFYADATPVQFAKGFTRFKDLMYPNQYREFMDKLILHFGRNPYFRRKKGEIWLTPQEQSLIRSVLQQVGADATMEFDDYVKAIYWKP